MTCELCGYNLPHHSERCAQATPLVFACATHRPANSSSYTDDMSRPPSCSVCGAPGAKGYR